MVAEDIAPRRAVAAFDVDGTLTRRDCLRPFLQRLGGRRALVVAVLRRPLASAVALVRLDRDAFKEIVVGSVFDGRSVVTVDAAGDQLARHVLAAGLRADTTARLRWHLRRGDAVVLVSASLGPYLRPLGTMLGVDAVLCTDVVHHGDRYGSRLDGGNCRGPEKARRLSAWLAERSDDVDSGDVWAYGDSAGDAALLALAQHPIWVGRSIEPVPGDVERAGSA